MLGAICGPTGVPERVARLDHATYVFGFNTILGAFLLEVVLSRCF